MSGRAEEAVQAALMALLRADADVQSVFGTPARVFDAESEEPLFPYALIERHETTPAGASLVNGIEHRISLACYSRDDGVRGAKACLSAAFRKSSASPPRRCRITSKGCWIRAS